MLKVLIFFYANNYCLEAVFIERSSHSIMNLKLHLYENYKNQQFPQIDKNMVHVGTPAFLYSKNFMWIFESWLHELHIIMNLLKVKKIFISIGSYMNNFFFRFSNIVVFFYRVMFWKCTENGTCMYIR